MNNLTIYERIINLRNKYQSNDNCNYAINATKIAILGELLTLAFRNNDSLPTKLNLTYDTTSIEEVNNLILEVLKDLGYTDSVSTQEYSVCHSGIIFHFCCR